MGVTDASGYDSTNAVAVSCGDYHTSILLNTGKVVTFGLGDNGQLGNNVTSGNFSLPSGVTDASGYLSNNALTVSKYTINTGFDLSQNFSGGIQDNFNQMTTNHKLNNYERSFIYDNSDISITTTLPVNNSSFSKSATNKGAFTDLSATNLNSINIGYDLSGKGAFTDLSATNLNSINIGYDLSGKGAFTDLSAQKIMINNNYVIPTLTTFGSDCSNIVCVFDDTSLNKINIITSTTSNTILDLSTNLIDATIGSKIKLLLKKVSSSYECRIDLSGTNHGYALIKNLSDLSDTEIYQSDSFNYIQLNGTTQGGAGADMIDLIKTQTGWFAECNLNAYTDSELITPFKNYT